jgi:hypothetical protein
VCFLFLNVSFDAWKEVAHHVKKPVAGFYRPGWGWSQYCEVLIVRAGVGLIVLRGDDRSRNFLCSLTDWDAGFDWSTCAGERRDIEVTNLKIGRNSSHKEKTDLSRNSSDPRWHKWLRATWANDQRLCSLNDNFFIVTRTPLILHSNVRNRAEQKVSVEISWISIGWKRKSETHKCMEIGRNRKSNRLRLFYLAELQRKPYLNFAQMV